MKSMQLLLLLTALTVGCEGQQKNNPGISGYANDSSKTKSSPQTNIIVNKNYDSKGKLIQYDSSYSYHFSSPGSSPGSILSDSLYYEMKTPLHLDYNRLLESRLDSIFFTDTLFKYDFYNNDYFSKRFQLNMLRFENMFREMDSLKLRMMENAYPNGRLKKK